jgi:uridine monophosphate synthetase
MSIIRDLFNINVIKFGEYELKDGSISPIYIDMRTLYQHPSVFKNIITLTKSSFENKWNAKYIIGLPYTGIPLATAFSLSCGIPMLLMRKTRKQYGTNKLIEGYWEKNDQVWLIDDIITTGLSKKQYIDIIESEGLKVTNIITIFDRRIDENILVDISVPLKCFFTIQNIIQTLIDDNLINKDQFKHLE